MIAMGTRATAPAFAIFPNLRRFKGLTPRSMTWTIPPGNDREPLFADKLRSVQYVYHDLGVLVYGGCTKEQIRTIGDIIKTIVVARGPGGYWTSLGSERRVRHRRFDQPRPDDIEPGSNVRKPNNMA